MDKQFTKNQKIEALDTQSGLWRSATAYLVTALTVTIHFPGFRNMSTLVEYVPERIEPSNWPVRHVTPAPEEPTDDEPKPNSLKRSLRSGIPKLPTEKAENKVTGDTVSFNFILKIAFNCNVVRKQTNIRNYEILIAR